MLHVRYSQAWNLSNGHDLAVLATEARRRGLPMGATASPVEGAATNPVDADFEKANPTTWPDAMILDAIEKHHSLTPEARARGLELGRAGYVNTHGTWKLTTKGRDALRRAEETGEDAWHDASSHRLAVANPLEVGRGTFTQHLKLHHYHGSLRITDLQNAGKRGKKVKELSVMPRTLNDAEADAILGRVADTIVQQDMTYAQAVAYLESQGKEEYRLEEHSLRGIDVEPAGVTINLEKKFDDGSIVRIESSPNDFHVVSSVPIHAPDKKAHGWRQDTIYSPKAKADGIAFYAWLKENLSKAAEMPIEKLRKTWDSLGVRYDYH